MVRTSEEVPQTSSGPRDEADFTAHGEAGQGPVRMTTDSGADGGVTDTVDVVTFVNVDVFVTDCRRSNKKGGGKAGGQQWDRFRLFFQKV